MSEEQFGLKDIIEEIDETFRPLELVSLYIIWKNNNEMEVNELEKELKPFIDSITPKILKKMIDYCAEQGLINKDKDGYIISLKNNKTKTGE